MNSRIRQSYRVNGPLEYLLGNFPVWRSDIVTVLRLYLKLVRMLETEGAISVWVETVRVCSSPRTYFNVVQGNYLRNLEDSR